MSEEQSLNRRATDQFVSLLSDHTRDEMERYQAIMDKIDTNDAVSNDRHNDTHKRIDALTKSIDSFMGETSEFHSAVKRAFPRDEEGNPDYDGHKSAHLSWISDSKASKELKLYIQKVVLGAAGIAVVSWIWAVIWPAFIHGPK